VSKWNWKIIFSLPKYAHAFFFMSTSVAVINHLWELRAPQFLLIELNLPFLKSHAVWFHELLEITTCSLFRRFHAGGGSNTKLHVKSHILG